MSESHEYHAKLIRIAAALVRGEGLPPYFEEDWPQKSFRRAVVCKLLESVHESCREWGVRLTGSADALKQEVDRLQVEKSELRKSFLESQAVVRQLVAELESHGVHVMGWKG